LRRVKYMLQRLFLTNVLLHYSPRSGVRAWLY
jgi:hypothetical protein